ncbi:hypothetical protein HDV00_012704 [Rhizophlyctis rosea]|nr:hypothetical protein HDV00_012704 [Rhizophlyctis rosea]
MGPKLYYILLVPGSLVFIIGWIYIFLGYIGGTRLRRQRKLPSFTFKTPARKSSPSYTQETTTTYSLPKPSVSHALSWNLNDYKAEEASTRPHRPPPARTGTKHKGVKGTRSARADSTYSESLYTHYL